MCSFVSTAFRGLKVSPLPDLRRYTIVNQLHHIRYLTSISWDQPLLGPEAPLRAHAIFVWSVSQSWLLPKDGLPSCDPKRFSGFKAFNSSSSSFWDTPWKNLILKGPYGAFG